MAHLAQLYNHIPKVCSYWDDYTMKCALVLSTYTFDATDTAYADISSHEVADGDGYTTGGVAVTPSAPSTAGTDTTFDSTDPAWTALTKTFRYAVFYLDDTVAGITKPLLMCVTFRDSGNTPTDIVVTSSNFTIQVNASGVCVGSV